MNHEFRENYKPAPTDNVTDNEFYVMLFLMFALGFALAVVVLT